jgi:hypothetical protein
MVHLMSVLKPRHGFVTLLFGALYVPGVLGRPWRHDPRLAVQSGRKPGSDGQEEHRMMGQAGTQWQRDFFFGHQIQRGQHKPISLYTSSKAEPSSPANASRQTPSWLGSDARSLLVVLLRGATHRRGDEIQRQQGRFPSIRNLTHGLTAHLSRLCHEKQRSAVCCCCCCCCF